MSDGVFISDRPQLAIARQTVSFASLGLNDPTLCRIIYEVGNPYLSYVPTDEFNPISGITEGKSYLLYLNSFFDGSPALANAVLTNLIPQTSTNVFAGERVVFLCTSSVSFATAGINATNTNLITLVSEGYFTSYDPNDSINGIDGFVEGELYDIDPITDIDLHLYGVTEIRYSDEVLYLDSLEDVVVTNSNPDATLPLAEEEVLVRNITTGVWENKPVSDLPTGTTYTDSDARAAISLTTTGTSGAATYDNSTGVLNVPNYNTGSATLVKPGNANYTATAIEQAIIFETTLTGNRTLTIPTATGNTGLRISIGNFQTAIFTITLSCVSSILYNGSAIGVLSKGDWITIMSDGTSWYVVQSVGKIGSGVYILKGYGTQSTLANSASVDTIFPYTLPANSLTKKGDRLRIYFFWLCTGGGSDNITVRIKSGTTTIIARASTGFGQSNYNTMTMDLVYDAATSTLQLNNYYASGNLVNSTVGSATSLIDWTAANDFTVGFTTGATTSVQPIFCQYEIYKE